MEIRFRRDTAFRKTFFVPDSFAHPAKMDAQLLIWLVENYTKVSDVILDPMFGSGTTMLACTLGRNVIGVELEQKFIDMSLKNWEEVRMRPQLGYGMGWCEILQGDARNLDLLADKIISSPPYSGISMGGGLNTKPPREGHNDQAGRSPQSPSQAGAGRYADIAIFSPPYTNRMDGGCKGSDAGMRPYSNEPRDTWRTKRDQTNIGNLPYGEIDKIITSPPFQEPEIRRSGQAESRGNYNYGSKLKMSSEHPDNISRLAENDYGNISAVISSPPYEAAVSASTGGERDMASARQREKRLRDKGYDPAKYQGGVGRNLEVDFQYSKSEGNIGNLKSQSYLQAMLQVYLQCYKCLKPQGLLILVLKNFIRNKQVVRLDLDTIKLCEEAGFQQLRDGKGEPVSHKRKLPAQSFWRVIYHQKHPEIEQIKYEDILIFNKD